MTNKKTLFIFIIVVLMLLTSCKPKTNEPTPQITEDNFSLKLNVADRLILDLNDKEASPKVEATVTLMNHGQKIDLPKGYSLSLVNSKEESVEVSNIHQGKFIATAKTVGISSITVFLLDNEEKKIDGITANTIITVTDGEIVPQDDFFLKFDTVKMTLGEPAKDVPITLMNNSIPVKDLWRYTITVFSDNPAIATASYTNGSVTITSAAEGNTRVTVIINDGNKTIAKDTIKITVDPIDTNSDPKIIVNIKETNLEMDLADPSNPATMTVTARNTFQGSLTLTPNDVAVKIQKSANGNDATNWFIISDIDQDGKITITPKSHLAPSTYTVTVFITNQKLSGSRTTTLHLEDTITYPKIILTVTEPFIDMDLADRATTTTTMHVTARHTSTGAITLNPNNITVKISNSLNGVDATDHFTVSSPDQKGTMIISAKSHLSLGNYIITVTVRDQEISAIQTTTLNVRYSGPDTITLSTNTLTMAPNSKKYIEVSFTKNGIPVTLSEGYDLYLDNPILSSAYTIYNRDNNALFIVTTMKAVPVTGEIIVRLKDPNNIIVPDVDNRITVTVIPES